MRDAGIGEAEITKIQAENWDQYVIFDYTVDTLGGSYVPDGADNATIARWKSLRDFDQPASPDAIKQFLDDIKCTNPENLAMLDAYRYYLAHRKHRDAALWAHRRDIPRLKVAKG